MNKQNKLTDDEKRAWFKQLFEELQRKNPINSEEDLIKRVHYCRKEFKKIYDRDVPGSFIRRLFVELGLERQYGAGVQAKRDFMFSMLDKNQAYRENKTQTRKIVEHAFGERILGIVFDEIWEEYQHLSDSPDPEMNVDLFGQESIF